MSARERIKKALKDCVGRDSQVRKGWGARENVLYFGWWVETCGNITMVRYIGQNEADALETIEYWGDE